MTVVDLHPEELFDKLVDGEISAIERERLRAHLVVCAVCRFEYSARVDFEQEPAQRLAPRLPLGPSVAPAVTAGRRRRSRIWLWGIPAVALISASGALASTLASRPWQALTQLFVAPPPSPPPSSRVLQRRPRSVETTPPRSPSIDEAPPAPPAPPRAFSEVGAREPVVERPARVERLQSSWPARSIPAEPAPPEHAAPESPSAATLFSEGNRARRGGELGRASGLYRVLQERYPSSPEAELSRVTLSMLLLDGGDAAAALAGFERYLAGSSRALEAEALVGRARALRRLGLRDREVSAWQEVQRRFPHSVYARQAVARLASLGPP